MFKSFIAIMLWTSFSAKLFESVELLVSTEKGVTIINASSDKFSLDITKNIKTDDYPVYIDYHYEKGIVCWSTIKSKTVQCIWSNSTLFQAGTRLIEVDDLVHPEGVAVDWLGNSLYWADSGSETIEVISLVPPYYRSVLYWTNLTNVNVLVVVPAAGLMFWSKWDTQPAIEVASMAGRDGATDGMINRRVIVSDDISWPNGLAVDSTNEILYFADAKNVQPCIEAVGFDGSNRRKIVNQDLKHPFTLNYFNNSLYWTDWNTKSIHKCTLMVNCGRPKQIEISLPIESLRVYSRDLQIADTSCSGSSCLPNNDYSPCHGHQCSHMCLLAPSKATREQIFLSNSTAGFRKVIGKPSFECSCVTGVNLRADGQTCNDGPQRFLLLARQSGLFRVSLDRQDHSMLPLGAFTRDKETRHDAVEVDYDLVTDQIFWIDDKLKKVRSTREYASGKLLTQDVLSLPSTADGFALDSRNRNFYWTDQDNQRIHVASMDGRAHIVVVWSELDRPRALAVHGTQSLLFWTDWGSSPKIERATVAGEDRRVLVNTNIEWPNAIAIDEVHDTVYWVDGRLERIECVGLDGSLRRRVLEEGLQHLDGISLLGTSIYWLDRSQRAVFSAQLDGSNVTYMVRDARNIQDIKAVKRDRDLPTSEQTNILDDSFLANLSPCALNKGNCSHICFSTPRSGRICKCPAELELSDDERTCVPPSEQLGRGFLLYSNGSSGLYRMSLADHHSSQPLPIAPVRAISVAYDPVEGKVYYIDSGSRKVRRSLLDGSAAQIVIRQGLLLPQALAVDHVNRNLYWIDMQLNRLEVSLLDGAYRRVLVWRDVVRPFSLALDSLGGLIFWSEQGDGHSVIRSAGLDGSNVQTIVDSGLGQQVALTVDASVSSKLSGTVSRGRLYWTDAEHHRLEACDYTGSHRQVLRQLPEGSYGIAVWRNVAYWAQPVGASHSLFFAAEGGAPRRLRSDVNMTSLLFSVAFDATAEDRPPSSCDHAKCSQLCLPAPKQQGDLTPCTCSSHYTLLSDGISCAAPRWFLLLAERSSISRVLNSEECGGWCPAVELAVRGIRSVALIAYDPVEHILFWLDKKFNKVFASQEGVLKKQIVLDGVAEGAQPYSLDVDYITGQLFWSCELFNTINVTRRVTTKEGLAVYHNLGTVVGLTDDRPRSLALHAPLRLLFFVNMATAGPRIESCHVDGSRRLVLVDSQISEPSGLVVGTGSHAPRLYWFDTRLHAVESIAIDGRDRRLVVSGGLERVVGLTVLRGSLYWADAASNSVLRVDLRSADNAPVTVVSGLHDLTHLVAVDIDEALRPHPCVNECSELCLLIGNSSIYGSAALSPEVYTSRLGNSVSSRFLHARKRAAIGSSRLSSLNNADLLGDDRPTRQREIGYGRGVTVSSLSTNAFVHSDHQLLARHRIESASGMVEGACGCVYSKTLAEDGSTCEPCTDYKHFMCARIASQCIPLYQRCDAVAQCWDGTDENNCSYVAVAAEDQGGSGGSNKAAYIVGVVASLFVLVCVAAGLVYNRRLTLRDAVASANLSSGLKTPHSLLGRGVSVGKKCYPPPAGSSCQRLLPDSSTACSAGCLNGSCKSSCATHLNGGPPSQLASEMFSLSSAVGAPASSSSSSTTHYPKQTANPPPTPTTRQPLEPCSCCHLLPPYAAPHFCSPALADAIVPPRVNDHSYRHYKARNRPPPPTPCSTDVCDESDLNSVAMLASSPSCSSDNNEGDLRMLHLERRRGGRTKGRHHPHPNSPNVQYCSLSSIARVEYYCCDTEPHPPPPTPHQFGESYLEPEPVTSQHRDMRRYCPPPPSPLTSD